MEQIADALPGLDLRVAEPFLTELPASLAGRPHVRAQRAGEAVDEADIVVVLVDHDHFRSLNRARLDGKVVYDTHPGDLEVAAQGEKSGSRSPCPKNFSIAALERAAALPSP